MLPENEWRQSTKAETDVCNLREAYMKIGEIHPDTAVSFYKFSELRLKWSVLDGACGIHTMCVQFIRVMQAIDRYS
jgi:hypothetical protein